MQEIRKSPSFSPITATCRAVYEKVNRLNVAVARAKSLAMLVANGIPPNQYTNAWMTADEQYVRFFSLAGTSAFAIIESLGREIQTAAADLFLSSAFGSGGTWWG